MDKKTFYRLALCYVFVLVALACIGPIGPITDPNLSNNPPVDDCPAGKNLCSGSCKVLSSDASHCGACGVVCAEGLSCVDGACVKPAPTADCPAGETLCDGACQMTNTDSNAGACGPCGVPCNAAQGCVDGVCVGA